MLPKLNTTQIEALLSVATGSVSYQSDTNYFGTKTTAIITDGRVARKTYASTVLGELLATPPPAPRQIPVATGKRSEAYTGPFPRKRHSHRCLRCGGNAVACHKAQCTVAPVTGTCKYCR